MILKLCWWYMVILLVVFAIYNIVLGHHSDAVVTSALSMIMARLGAE